MPRIYGPFSAEASAVLPTAEPSTGYEYAQYIAESLNASLSEDDEVETWPDEIGSNDLTDTGSGPRFKDNRVNSLASVHFSGSQAMEATGIDTGSTHYAVLMAWRENQGDSDDRAYLDGDDSGNRLLFQYEDSGAIPGGPGHAIFRGPPFGGGGQFAVGDTSTFHSYNCTAIVCNDVAVAVRLNGTQIGSSGGTLGSRLVGLRLNDDLAHFFSGGSMEVAELVILVDPSECAILQWEFWLMQKYDLPGAADTTAPTISNFQAAQS